MVFVCLYHCVVKYVKVSCNVCLNVRQQKTAFLLLWSSMVHPSSGCNTTSMCETWPMSELHLEISKVLVANWCRCNSRRCWRNSWIWRDSKQGRNAIHDLLVIRLLWSLFFWQLFAAWKWHLATPFHDGVCRAQFLSCSLRWQTASTGYMKVWDWKDLLFEEENLWLTCCSDVKCIQMPFQSALFWWFLMHVTMFLHWNKLNSREHLNKW